MSSIKKTPVLTVFYGYIHHEEQQNNAIKYGIITLNKWLQQ